MWEGGPACPSRVLEQDTSLQSFMACHKNFDQRSDTPEFCLNRRTNSTTLPSLLQSTVNQARQGEKMWSLISGTPLTMAMLQAGTHYFIARLILLPNCSSRLKVFIILLPHCLLLVSNWSFLPIWFHRYPSSALAHLVFSTQKLEPEFLFICLVYRNIWLTNSTLPHQSPAPTSPPLSPPVFSPSHSKMSPHVNPKEQSTPILHQHGLRSHVVQAYVHYCRIVPLATQSDIKNKVTTLIHDMAQVTDTKLHNICGAWVPDFGQARGC